MDPRKSAIKLQLSRVKKIIAVTGCKGGIGKSVTAATLALLLAKQGKKTGLLDLDFFSPSGHLILGSLPEFPKEEKGIIPPKIHGIEFMSIVFFTEGQPVPVRGKGVSDALVELLAITAWGELDALVIDMPPGLGDSTLELLLSAEKAEFLVLSTPSELSKKSAQRLLAFLKEAGKPVLGIIENMARENNEKNSWGEKFLGRIMLDSSLENAIGKPSELLETGFAKQLSQLAEKVL